MIASVRPLAALVAGLVVVNPAQATEGGGSSKALGVGTVLAGVMAPPGLRLTTYIVTYDADKTVDGNGNPRAGVSNFKLRVNAIAPRFQYVWSDVTVLGANVETRIAGTVYLKSRVGFDIQTPRGTVHRQDAVESSGDMLIAPVLLGWHAKRLHQVAGVELYAPTGSFNPGRLANTSRGYWTIGPTYMVTWFPSDATEVSLSMHYLRNYRNPDTKYRSGDEIAMDYGLGYAATSWIQVGMSGYVYKQIANDKVNGTSVAGGNRGQVFAYGPFIRFHPSKDWGITLKWQHETWVENRAVGDRLWLQFALKLF